MTIAPTVVTDTSATGLLLDRILRETERHPMLSAGARKAYELLQEDDFRVSMLAGYIQWDPCLAARILAIANSALYAPPRPIERLDDAIVLIGGEELRSMILAASTTSFVSRLSFQEERTRNLLCHHACLTAILARQIALGCRLVYHGEEFCAGLLHDIGRFLLAAFEPKLFAKLGALDDPRDADFVARERQLLGLDHCELGRAFCEHHGFGGHLSKCAAFHHVAAGHADDSELTRLVAIADDLATQINGSSAANPYDPEEDPYLPGSIADFTRAMPVEPIAWLGQLARAAQRQASTMTMLFAAQTQS